jgi:hypothetical protein
VDHNHRLLADRVPGNTRPRVSGSQHPAGRRSRPARMAGRCRSTVAAVTTWVPVRVGCSVFLNNRYYDPALGIFLSVDPLVAKPGTRTSTHQATPPPCPIRTGSSQGAGLRLGAIRVRKLTLLRMPLGGRPLPRRTRALQGAMALT